MYENIKDNLKDKKTFSNYLLHHSYECTHVFKFTKNKLVIFMRL